MNKQYLKDVVAKTTGGGVDSLFMVSGDAFLPMMSRVCFGSFTKSFNSKKKCDITVRVFTEVPSSGNLFSVTPFEPDEIIQYLNDLKKIFPFEFSIEQNEVADREGLTTEFNYLAYNKALVEKRKCYDITYSIEGPHIAFMFILTLQRFLYAKGDSVFLALALKIKNEHKEFEKMNLFNILNCVISTTSDNSRGGDMFHFDATHFMYLWESGAYRDYLLALEDKAQKHVFDNVKGVADLANSSIYCYDNRFRKEYMSYDERSRFTIFQDVNAKKLNRIIDLVINNLTVLRDYNGYSKLGETRLGKIRERLSDGPYMNYYSERLLTEASSNGLPPTKFDESLLDK